LQITNYGIYKAVVCYYFATAIVPTEFSLLTASSSVSCRIISPPTNLICNVAHGLGLTTSSLVTVSDPTCTERLYASGSMESVHLGPSACGTSKLRD